MPRWFYHGKCVELLKQSVANLQLPGESWFCPNCRPDRNQGRPSNAFPLMEEEEEDEPPASALTLKIVRKTQSDIIYLNNKQKDIMHSVSFCSDQISSFESIIKKLTINWTPSRN
ncbi:hypothetical protein JTB14_022354 [Gonioctena quinquepunctata]|nr:hypothetical protein JTB14_022354 [Gonioctena quinquepunctata]